MKISVINGSPHKGNTWRLTEIVMAQIKGLDKTVEFTDIHLSACNIPFCTGCSLCFRKGHRFCPHNQYIQPIMEKIEESDGVIFAASCFQGAVPALGKNFTDHLAF
ncbi:MAG: NAD(P)H-dependent oxidoreductase, partial [Firmicutes bacterium]|nr:NAD(P)H-dependent oxidoreductase [Bacillota bacterium]